MFIKHYNVCKFNNQPVHYKQLTQNLTQNQKQLTQDKDVEVATYLTNCITTNPNLTNSAIDLPAQILSVICTVPPKGLLLPIIRPILQPAWQAHPTIGWQLPVQPDTNRCHYIPLIILLVLPLHQDPVPTAGQLQDNFIL